MHHRGGEAGGIVITRGTTYPARGSYVLLIELDQPREISIGSRGIMLFPGGYYAYIGSAMGGFNARLNHHRHRQKKPKWHIDYLLLPATLCGVILIETTERTECAVARELQVRLSAIAGFGASDCRCSSHLFMDTRPVTADILAALESLQLPARLVLY